MDIKNLLDKIDECDEEYYNNHRQIVSDQEYDGLKDSLKVEISKFSPISKADEKLLVRMKTTISRVGAPPPKDGKWPKVVLTVPMPSLNKVNTPEELYTWIAKCNYAGKFLATEKLDGTSVSLEYDKGKFIRAATRGSGVVGENITPNVRKMKGCIHKLPKDFTGFIRGEMVIRHSDMVHFPEMANARNGASGVAKRLDGDGCEHLSIIVYTVEGQDFKTELEQFQFLESLGFTVPSYEICQNQNEVVALWHKYMDSIRDSLDYDIDGQVIRINDLTKQLALGDENHRPKGQIAFKFEAPEARTTIRNIIWQVGNTGRITPVAVFDSVSLMGAEIERASMYNLSFIQTQGVDIGAEVLIIRGNDVIPVLKSVVKSTGSVAKAPEVCPVCGAGVIRDGEYLLCSDKTNCPAQTKGRILSWIKEQGILEWGKKVIDKLIDKGLVNDVFDLYKLTAQDIFKLDRMGEKSAENLIKELDKFREIPLENLIGGLTINGVGTTSVKAVMEAGYDTLDKIQAVSLAQLQSIPGFGLVKADQFYYGLKYNKERIEKILASGVKIKPKIVGKLNGKSFCFTGTMQKPRAVLQGMVKSAGGTVKDSVGRGLDYLVVEDPNGTSSKLQAARKNGIKLISEDDFLKML